MSVRLGFAVAANLIDPDILILDEVLAVGDIGFVIKCMNRVRQLTSKAAVIFVSHSLPMVSTFCTRGILMNHGEIECESNEISEVVTAFLNHYASPTQRSGTGESRFEDCSLIEIDENGNRRKVTKIQQSTLGEIEVTLITEVAVTLNCQIDTAMLTPLISLAKHNQNGDPEVYPPGRHKITINLGRIDLNAGKYSVILMAATPERPQITCRQQGIISLIVSSEIVAWCPIVRHG